MVKIICVLASLERAHSLQETKMKKFISVLFFVLVVCNFTACEQGQVITNNYESRTQNSYSSDEFAVSNETLPIYNIHNEPIGEITHYGFIAQANNSIVYAKIPTGTTNIVTEMDYYRYIIDTKENIKLGTINDWSQQSTEVVYLDNHLYLMVMTGDITSKESRTLKLLDVNLNNNSLSEVFSEKGGFPYNSMVGVGSKLLMAKVLSNASCVDEYDITTKEIKTLIKFDFNDKTTTGETIRQICADDNTISLMMLVKETADSVKLRVDVYDHNMQYMRSVDTTDISSVPNERLQGISNFQFSDGNLYYENFSSTRFLGQTKNNQVLKTIDTNDTFAMATETENNKVKVFYQSFSLDNNHLYLWNTENGNLLKGEFYADDKRYYIVNMTRDSNDNCLITLYYRAKDSDEKLKPRLYYINLKDLDFK